jgi:hypothetical protein
VLVEAEQEDGGLAGCPAAGVLEQGIDPAGTIQHDANLDELMFGNMVGTADGRVN